jgi:hypothetical protein
MQHLRIATYRQTGGTFDEVSEVLQAPGGLADVFRASPGFVSYVFADLGDGINCSISTWSTAEAADAATAAARTWVAANIADLGQLIDDRTGRIGFAIGELAATPA